MVADDFPTNIISLEYPHFQTPPNHNDFLYIIVYPPLNPMKMSLLLMVISGDIPIVSPLNPNKSLLLMVINIYIYIYNYIYTHHISYIPLNGQTLVHGRPVPSAMRHCGGASVQDFSMWHLHLELTKYAVLDQADVAELPTLVDLQIPGNLETNETHVYQVS